VNRRSITWTTIVVLAVAALAGALWYRSANASPAGVIQVAGDVRADVVTVRAPAIVRPVPDYTVGIPRPAGTPAPGVGPKRQMPPSASSQPTVSGPIAVMYVSPGDHVKTGQPLAQLDTGALQLGLQQAQTASAKAHAEVPLLTNNLATLDTAGAKLSTAKGQLATARTKLATGRAQLLAQLAQLEQLAAHMPPGPPPPGQPNPAVLIPQLKAALAQLDAGQAKLNTAAAQLGTASAQLSTAKKQLTHARDLLRILADAQDIGVRLAEVRLAQATILSPVDGVVLEARHAGEIAMVNAPLVRIRPDGAREVDTYLTSDQLALVKVGTPVEVAYDSAPGVTVRGSIARIAPLAVVPPTSFPTSIVHMTRAIRVTVSLEGSSTVPYGTPVDVTIHTD
jgi:membrane fusion protein, multidrug efflux system